MIRCDAPGLFIDHYADEQTRLEERYAFAFATVVVVYSLLIVGIVIAAAFTS